MPISEKSRKILWARSGNRCASCRVRLVIDQTLQDAESVIGEECHIVSAAVGGPRYQARYPSDRIDLPENLVLLCAVHHKMVDDQREHYSAEVLRTMKRHHEMWVETKLRDDVGMPPIRIRRFRKNIPAFLPRITSGRELMAMGLGCSAHYFDHDDNLSEVEAELVGNFAQDVKDWIDISGDLEPIDRVRASCRLQSLLAELEENGFLIFAGSETQQIEGGLALPQNFPVMHLAVLRQSSPYVYQGASASKSEA